MTLDVHIVQDADGGVDRATYRRLKERLTADPTANLVSRKPSDDCVCVFTNIVANFPALINCVSKTLSMDFSTCLEQGQRSPTFIA